MMTFHPELIREEIVINYVIIGFILGCLITYLLVTKAYRRALRRLIQEINLKNVVLEKLKDQLKIKDGYIYKISRGLKKSNEKAKYR